MPSLSHTHVRFCSRGGGNRNVRSHDAGHIEVGEMYVTLRVQQHVGRLHITVDDPPLSQVLQGQCNPSQIESDTRQLESSFLLKVVT